LIRVLLAKVPHPSQGGDATAWITTTLAERYNPYFLTMVGLCAGDPRALAFGDAVIASSTVRHDYGKIEPNRLGKLRFEHRVDHRKIDPTLMHSLVEFVEHRGTAPFKVKLGVMSTCNQVTKVPKVFEYLTQNIVRGLAGDSDDRTLMALEMEAHAVAYAAQESKIPTWLVIKGVCDHADAKKGDKPRARAIRNATTIALQLLRTIIVTRFLAEERYDAGREAEREAEEAFKQGDVEAAKKYAEDAYLQGRRSPTTRRRYLHSLMQLGEDTTVKELIKDLRQTVLFYDHVTLAMEATRLWRQGDYGEVSRLLTDKRVEGHRQLMYLKAINNVFLHGAAPAALTKARSLLEQALKLPPFDPRPWWIEVNLFWVLRLLKAPAAARERVFRQADASLRSAIGRSPKSGARSLYLLLFAISDKEEDFDREAKKMIRQARSVHVALELVDMVYERLEKLREKQVIKDTAHYWTTICRWLRQAKKVGRTVRRNTAEAMK
jgi:nucleoside phosphorylase